MEMHSKIDDFSSTKKTDLTIHGDLPKDVAAGLLGGASIGNEPSLHILFI